MLWFQFSCKLSAQLWDDLALSSWALPALSPMGGPGAAGAVRDISLSLSLCVKVCRRCLSALGGLVAVRGHTQGDG